MSILIHPMRSKSAFTSICFVLLSLTVCRSQEQQRNDLYYLADHAVFFTNGIRSYQEHGKYGFIYKNHRLTEAVYDTVYHFGQEVCVVKRGTVFSLLDRNLKNTYYQPIERIEKYYSKEKQAFILKITDPRGYVTEYITDASTGWSVAQFSQGNTFPLHRDPSGYARNIVDSIDRSDRFPEANGRGEVKVLMNQKRTYHSPYAEILFCGNLLKFFPKSGAPFIRERSGISVSDYLGESLVVYRDPEKNQLFVIDEEREDTIAVSEYQFTSFIRDGQLYLSSQSYMEHGTVSCVKVYTNKGVLVHTYTPGVVNGKKNRAWFSGGRISEEIKYVNKGKNGYSLYAIYDPVTLERVLDNVLEIASNNSYSFCYSPQNRTYHLLRSGQIIYSIRVKKGNHATFHSLGKHDLFEKEPVCIRIMSADDHLIESVLISASGKTLCRTDQKTFGFSISQYQDAIEIHEIQRTDDANKRFGLYAAEADSIYWFPMGNSTIHALTKGILHYTSKAQGQNQLKTRSGDTLFTFGDQQLFFIPLENDHFLLTLTDDSSSVYNDRFQLLCSDCSITPVNRSQTSGKMTFLLCRSSQQAPYSLVDEQLNPVHQEKYRAVLSGAGNMVALLTENGTITYWMIGE